MMELIVASECDSRKRRAMRSFGWHCRTIIDRHAQYFAVPLEHGVQVGCYQPVMLQLRMDNDLGIHFSPVDVMVWDYAPHVNDHSELFFIGFLTHSVSFHRTNLLIRPSICSWEAWPGFQDRQLHCSRRS